MASSETRGELSFSLIQELGGTKEDLQLLEGLGEDEEAEDLDLDAANDWDADPIKKDELRDFIEQLGIKKHRPDVIEEKRSKEKEAKLQKSEVDNNESRNSEAEQSSSKSKTAASGNARRQEKNKYKVQHSDVTSTTLSEKESLANHLKSPESRSYLLFKPGDSWLDSQKLVNEKPAEYDLIQTARNFAAQILEREVTLYKERREHKKRSDSHWLKTVLTSGTLSDKMAALTLQVEESPVHSLSALDSLVAMVHKKGKREAMMAADTLKELMSSMLPSDRKLIAFDARPLDKVWSTCGGSKDAVDKKLLSWYVEAVLKEKYSAFVAALDVMSFDTILATKRKAIDTMHHLLMEKPEQENVLLTKVVNKLGDPDYKLASHASYLLIRLVEQHPNMQQVIVAEVERLIYRPGISQRAQYYAMCFLNQIKLNSKDHILATKLITIYFSFFKMYVKKGEVDSKMMGALLTGVNRAYPFAEAKENGMLEQIGTLYKIVHLVNFNIALQALMLLQQVADPSSSEGDRFHVALYRKMLDAGLKTSAKHPQFLNLIYRSMKADVCDKRVKAFMKRLLQVGSQLGPDFLCGALIVLSQILKERPELLTIRQIGQDENKNEEQVTNSTSNLVGYEEDDDEEHFVDLPVPEEFQDKEKIIEDEGKTSRESPSSSHGSVHDPSMPSWVHRKNRDGKHEQQEYQPFQRNPLYCHAEHTVLFELYKLVTHYHPSVSLFARAVLEGQHIVYSGNPLEDFTLIRFLDRFVYKNPKKIETASQKLATVGAAYRKRKKILEGIVPVTSAEFIGKGEASVAEHERYLYKYFSQRAERSKIDDGEDGEDSEAGSVSDSEFDEFLDKYESHADEDQINDLDLDFASDLSKKGQKDRSKDIDSDISNDEEDPDNLSDEEMELEEDDELAAEFRKEMEELGDDSDDELKQLMLDSSKKSKKRAPVTKEDGVFEKKAKRHRGSNTAGDGIFAAAEEFADVLEENASNTLGSMGTSQGVSNPDKASFKQLAWEADRDRFLHGRHWSQRKGGKNTGRAGSHRKPARTQQHQHPGHRRKPGKGPKSGKKKN